jgi:SAM-dependent methyltransferase
MAVERLEPGTHEWQGAAAEHVSRYLFAAEWVAGRRVLDVGTGSGLGVPILLGAGAGDVQAIDRDCDAIDRASRTHGGRGAVFFVDDAHTLERVAKPVDVIISFENIEHLAEPTRFVAAAASALTPDGILICSSPDRSITPPFENGRPANPYHLHEWYQDEFLELFLPHFDKIDLRLQVRSAAFDSRRLAVDALEQHLIYLWSSPANVLLRALRRALFRPRTWHPIAGLAAAAPADYPIVPAHYAHFIGTPYCHVVVCRGPRVLP